MKRGRVLRKSELSNFVFFVDLPREKALAQGAVRDKPDSEFLQGRYHFLFKESSSTANTRSGGQ